MSAARQLLFVCVLCDVEIGGLDFMVNGRLITTANISVTSGIPKGIKLCLSFFAFLFLPCESSPHFAE